MPLSLKSRYSFLVKCYILCHQILEKDFEMLGLKVLAMLPVIMALSNSVSAKGNFNFPWTRFILSALKFIRLKQRNYVITFSLLHL